MLPNILLFFSLNQNGKIRSGTIAWPPYREPLLPHPAYSDPRDVLKSRIAHALFWLVLYKAVHHHNVSEHVISLVIYLLEMSLAVTGPTAQSPDQVFTSSSTNLFCSYNNVMC